MYSLLTQSMEDGMPIAFHFDSRAPRMLNRLAKEREGQATVQTSNGLTVK